MNLKDYIQGKRRGKEANRLEREAMNDPFLQDAIDGFDNVQGDHLHAIEALEKQISKRTQKRTNYRMWVLSVAASLALLFGVSYLIKINNLNQNEIAQQISDSIKPIEQPKVAVAEKDTTTVVAEHKNISQQIKKEKPKELAPPSKPVLEKEISVINDEAAISEEQVNENIEEPPVAMPLNVFAEEKAESVKQKKMVFGSINKKTIDAKEFEGIQVSSIDEALQGRVAGLDVASKPQAFGKKEFKEYFNKNRKTDICENKSATLKATFYIDAEGKPAKVKVVSCDCDELESEFVRLIKTSPQWTKLETNVEITIVVE